MLYRKNFSEESCPGAIRRNVNNGFYFYSEISILQHIKNYTKKFLPGH